MAYDQQDDIALIDQYLNGELDAQAVQEVEARMASEEAFRQAVERQRALYEGIEREGDRLLKQQLDAWFEDYKQTELRRGKWFRGLLWFLGSLLLLGGVYFGIQWFQWKLQEGPIDLPAQQQKQQAQQAAPPEPEGAILRDTAASASSPKTPDQSRETPQKPSLQGKQQHPLSLQVLRMPSRPRYTFQDLTLTLYGTHYADLAELEVVKLKDRLHLAYQGSYYPIQETAEPRFLEKVNDPRPFHKLKGAHGRGRSIQLVQLPFRAHARTETNTMSLLRHPADTLRQKYWFEQQKDSLRLHVARHLSVQSCLHDAVAGRYFIETSKDVYAIQPSAHWQSLTPAQNIFTRVLMDTLRAETRVKYMTLEDKTNWMQSH